MLQDAIANEFQLQDDKRSYRLGDTRLLISFAITLLFISKLDSLCFTTTNNTNKFPGDFQSRHSLLLEFHTRMKFRYTLMKNDP